MKIAIVQKGPQYYELDANVAEIKKLILEAKSNATEIIAFGECWLSGYPVWLDNYKDVSLWDHDPVKELWKMHYNSAVVIDGKEIQEISACAKKNNIAIVLGLNEKVNSGQGVGSVYNSVIIINEQGDIVQHHRKLMPTYTEKLVYAHGDGNGLNVAQLKNARVGALICWEHWMPHARQAMHLGNEEIHFALWPSVQERHQIASKHYAFEGRCYVVSIGQKVKASDLPQILESKTEMPEYLMIGGSCVAGPDAKFIMEPNWESEGIIYHELPSKDNLTKEKMTFSSAGHYNRPDVFEFKVNKNRT